MKLWRSLESWTSSDGNRNRKLEISRAPTKAKSREPAYSQALRGGVSSSSQSALTQKWADKFRLDQK